MTSPIDFTVLIDNNAHPSNAKLASEHGFSMTFSYQKKQWLYDTGETDLYATNAQALGFNLNTIDYLILSHGHKDHTGGLHHFLDLNTHAPIFASPEIVTDHYFSFRHEYPKNISTDHALLEHNTGFKPVASSQWLTKTIALVQNSCDTFAKPKANALLKVVNQKGLNADPFTHERAICIVKDHALIILSACSHNGVLNILQSCKSFCGIDQVSTFIGGMHLLDDYETEQDLKEICHTLQRDYPELKLYSGHCIGKKQLLALKQILGDQFQPFYSGWHLHLD